MKRTLTYNKRLFGRKLIIGLILVFLSIAFLIDSLISVIGCIVILVHLAYLLLKYHFILNPEAKLIKQEISLNKITNLIPFYIGSFLLVFGLANNLLISMLFGISITVIYFIIYLYMRNKK